MATNTYVALDKVTVSSATSIVTFSSIPQGYTDLVVVVNAKVATANDFYFQINSDSGNNYSRTILYGTGSTAGSTRTANTNLGIGNFYGNPDPTTPSVQTLQFMNYSNTTTYKTVLGRASNAAGGTDAIVNLWRSTSAITQLDFRVTTTASVNWLTGSTFSLYAIKSE